VFIDNKPTGLIPENQNVLRRYEVGAVKTLVSGQRFSGLETTHENGQAINGWSQRQESDITRGETEKIILFVTVEDKTFAAAAFTPFRRRPKK